MEEERDGYVAKRQKGRIGDEASYQQKRRVIHI
jgi:hypothetical protein